MTSTNSHLYGFTGDNVILERTIKLAITLGEPPQIETIMIDFLSMKCPLAFNGVLGRPLLKALIAMTLIHCLTMKFPIAKRIGQVHGRQRDSREYYSKSLELTEMELGLP